MKTGNLYYTGTIVEVVDPILYEILVDIPGFNTGIKAFPMRGELDEPRIGDFVVLKSLDPIFQSYFLYQKIKENDFIGMRSNGKMVDITPDYIKIAIFDPEEDYNDSSDNYRPEVKSWILIDKDGNLETNIKGSSSITINGEDETSITLKGKCVINIESSDGVEINSPKVELTSNDVVITGGVFTMTGTTTPSTTGPFNCIPTCPFTGAPHAGSRVNNT